MAPRVYRQGELHEARGLYERALEHDPAQPEARYNLANLLEDLGETELAIAELRRVCAAAPRAWPPPPHTPAISPPGAAAPPLARRASGPPPAPAPPGDGPRHART